MKNYQRTFSKKTRGKFSHRAKSDFSRTERSDNLVFTIYELLFELSTGENYHTLACGLEKNVNVA